MKVNKLVILLLSSVLFLTACSSTQAPPTKPLYLGTNGVLVSFPDSNALQQFQNDSFTLALRLENDGACDITQENPGYVTATFDSANLDYSGVRTQSGNLLSDTRTTIALRGRTQYVPVGDLQFMEFSFRTRPLTANRVKLNAPVTFQVCYPYTTTFVGNVCIDRDIYNTQASKSCTGGTITSPSQGAPIAITKIEPRYTRIVDPNDASLSVVVPSFQITLQNMQDGLVLGKTDPADTSDKACTLQQLDNQRFDRVLISGTLSNKKLDCGFTPNSDDGSGIARFDHGTATISCKLGNGATIQSGSNYESVLQLRAQYFYISSVTANVEVVR